MREGAEVLPAHHPAANSPAAHSASIESVSRPNPCTTFLNGLHSRRLEIPTSWVLLFFHSCPLR